MIGSNEFIQPSFLTFQFLYKDEKFEKPFFCTFFKTSMFTIYLVVMGMIAPWREACTRNGNYQLVESQEDDVYYTNGLSDSTFVPIKTPDTESDDSASIRSVRFSKLAEVREMNAAEATEALMSRLSYAASIRIRRQRTHHKTARAALVFCILWFIANYLFQLALDPSEPALVTLLSTTSSFFTLVLAASFPSGTGDRFTISKLFAVALTIGGASMVTMSEIKEVQSSRGIVLSLMSAFFYACYLVLVKRKNDTEEKIDIIEFFGFVGLFCLLLLWPLFLVLNFSQLEPFEIPNKKQFLILFLNGLIGTVISEALWLW
jgi:solute carrier family 35 protein F5